MRPAGTVRRGDCAGSLPDRDSGFEGYFSIGFSITVTV
jgi:hypothetical protein